MRSQLGSARVQNMAWWSLDVNSANAQNAQTPHSASSTMGCEDLSDPPMESLMEVGMCAT